MLALPLAFVEKSPTLDAYVSSQYRGAQATPPLDAFLVLTINDAS